MSKKVISVAALVVAAVTAVGTTIPAAAQTSQVQQDTQTSINGLVVGGTAERIDFSDPNHKGLGDKLRYDFTVTNTRTFTMYFYPTYGNFDGWETVPRAFAGTCNGTQRTLKPGESYSCWTEHTITRADLDAGFYKPDSSWRAMGSISSKVGAVPGVPVQVR